MTLLDDYSLLWPHGRITAFKNAKRLPYQAYTDLGIDKAARLLGADPNNPSLAEDVVRGMVTDKETIEYRLDVLDDFLRCPALCNELDEAFQPVEQLKAHRKKQSSRGHVMREILWQFQCLELYVDSIFALRSALDRHRRTLTSSGLRGLLSLLDQKVESGGLGGMKAELDQVRKQISDVSSVVIRIDLNSGLVPARAQLLSVDSGKPPARSWIANVLGRMGSRPEAEDAQHTYRMSSGSTIGLNAFLTNDLANIFEGALDAAKIAVSKYVNVNMHVLKELHPEMQYYARAAKLIRSLQNSGLTMVRPKVLPMEQRVCRLGDMRDMALALELGNRSREYSLDAQIVPNDVEFGDRGRLFILTGPNQGGKTTYTRAIGACQVLFQAGLYVPCSEAEMSPVDQVFTHFSEDDAPNSEDGRLSSECRRLREVFETATRHSLLLLNESLASTSPSEGLHLVKGVVKAISILGARAVLVTHHHDLAYQVDSINEELHGDSRLVSMVAKIADSRESGGEAIRTYRIVPGPPVGSSYAEDIASRHGVSFTQICDLMRRNGRIRDAEDCPSGGFSVGVEVDACTRSPVDAKREP